MADKGGKIVILNRTDYIRLAYKLLTNTQHYEVIQSDPLPHTIKTISTYLRKLNTSSLIDDKTLKYLLPDNPTRMPVFYILPKIHKPTLSARPIVSACAGPTEHISEFIDFFLQPLVQQLPSYIKDTNHFLEKINSLGPLPPNTILVSMDITSLYTNIPQAHAIEIIHQELLKTQTQAFAKALSDLLRFVLEHNFFSFNNTIYRQRFGIAMGTRAAPAIANLFVGHLETILLRTAEPNTRPFSWNRFIDDVICLFSCPPPLIIKFIKFANSIHPTIKFTYTMSKHSVSFLDTRLILKNGTLHTTLHVKATDSHAFLHFSSCHPRHCINAIPYGQAIRIIRICSSNQTKLEHLRNLYRYLHNSNYPHTLIVRQLNRALNRRRSTNSPNNHNTNNSRIPLVLTYNPRFPSIPRILHKHHTTTLLQNSTTADIFTLPPITSFRRPKNLKNLLTCTTLRPTQTTDTTKHNPNCQCNKHFLKHDTIKSNSSNTLYPIDPQLDCHSTNVIYLISCQRDGIRYVGQTANCLNTRLNHHKSDIKLKKDTPVAKHFNLPHHSIAHLRITPLFKCSTLESPTKSKILRLKLEKQWINNLDTLHPRGLNLI